MGENKKGNGILGKIVLAVVVALLVGGTAPWWWKELPWFNGDPNDSDRPPRTSGYELELIGPPRFDFLGSGGGVGPPRYRLGRYAFLSDVHVANHSDTQLVVRKVRVTLRNAAGLFAEGEQALGSLDRWKIAPGKTDHLEIQVRTDILQDKKRLKTRFELSAGRPKPRFEFVLHGSVYFEILTPTGELETKIFKLERFDVLIQPFGS